MSVSLSYFFKLQGAKKNLPNEGIIVSSQLTKVESWVHIPVYKSFLVTR